MLSAVARIGSLLEEIEHPSKPIEGYVVAIVFNEIYEFSDIELEQFQVEKIPHYLYKEGESKGNKPAPMAPITEIENTFRKIKNWIESCQGVQSLNEEEREILQKIVRNMEEHKDEILQRLREKIAEIGRKSTKFLTFKIGTKYPGEIELFTKAKRALLYKKIGKSSSKNKTCSICGRVKEDISARTLVYNFDTDDKPGFITGFDRKNFWKNFPVCLECMGLLERGRKFIDNKLTFRFYGLKYHLIPNTMTEDDQVIKEIIGTLADTHKLVTLKDRTIKRMTDDEEEILEFLSQKGDTITLNFLFLQQQQSAERILLLIEEVLPSRLRRIFAQKEEVDSLFGEEFNFGKIRTFFRKSDEDKKTYDLDKYFLEIVDSVFKGKNLSFSFLVKFFMQVIRKEFINDGFYLNRAKDALACVSFFEKIGILSFEEVTMERNVFDPLFEKYTKSLDTSAKRGVFLLGALTQMLLNKQYYERGSKPFMKKLKSLKMDEKDIKNLLTEVQNKLEEYDAFDIVKRMIARECARYLLEAGDGWKMSVDEINFYFVCGMSLSDEVAQLAYKKE